MIIAPKTTITALTPIATSTTSEPIRSVMSHTVVASLCSASISSWAFVFGLASLRIGRRFASRPSEELPPPAVAILCAALA